MGGKAPEPTDPHETSAATTGTNVSTAIANAMLNNVQENTPDGSTKVTQTGSYNMYDPYTKENYTIPTFTRDTTLSSGQQAIKDQQDAAKLNLSTLANDQSSFLQDYMSQPFSYDETAHTGWANDLYHKVNDQNLANADESLRSRLAAQGIKEGSQAYDRAMQTQSVSNQNAQNQFLLDSYNTGLQSALAQRNQPINEITALMSGSQVSQPNFLGANEGQIPTTNNASIISNYDQQRQQAAAANNSALWSGISTLGGLFLSDERAKKDKQRIGTHHVAGTDEDVGLYSFRYKGAPAGSPKQTGVMAQDVKRVKPSAVKKTRGGLYAVDYRKV